MPEGPTSPTFNEYGELRKEFIAHNMFYFDAETFNTEAELDDIVDACVIHSQSHLINSTTTFKKEPDYSEM